VYQVVSTIAVICIIHYSATGGQTQWTSHRHCWIRENQKKTIGCYGTLIGNPKLEVEPTVVSAAVRPAHQKWPIGTGAGISFRRHREDPCFLRQYVCWQESGTALFGLLKVGPYMAFYVTCLLAQSAHVIYVRVVCCMQEEYLHSI